MRTKQVRCVPALLLILVNVLSLFSLQVWADEQNLTISHVRGHIHQFHHASGSGVILEGETALIVGNPGNAEEADALYIQLLAEFDKPVRYVFATSAERAEGLSAFAKRGAVTVVHQAAADATEDLTINMAFAQQLTLFLDDRQVQLVYPGASTGTGTVVALFPDEEALYAIDVVAVNRLPDPALFQTAQFPAWFNAIETIKRLPFVYLLSGHNDIGIRNDAVQHGYFLRELQNRVKRAIEVGVTAEDLATSVDLGAYQRWGQFDAWSADVVRGMAATLN